MLNHLSHSSHTLLRTLIEKLNIPVQMFWWITECHGLRHSDSPTSYFDLFVWTGNVNCCSLLGEVLLVTCSLVILDFLLRWRLLSAARCWLNHRRSFVPEFHGINNTLPPLQTRSVLRQDWTIRRAETAYWWKYDVRFIRNGGNQSRVDVLLLFMIGNLSPRLDSCSDFCSLHDL